MPKNKNTEEDPSESRLSDLLFNKPEEFAEKLKAGKKKKSQNEDVEEIDRKPAWADDDDEAADTKGSNSAKSKEPLKNNLKRKFETLMGTPSWARIDKKNKEEDEDEDNVILRTVGHLKKKKSIKLDKDYLTYKKFPPIIIQKDYKRLPCVEFHPTASVVLVGSSSGKVSLYSVGGDVNNLLHKFVMKNFQLASAYFTPNGSEAYIASHHKNQYCVYDLMNAKPQLFELPREVRRSKIFVLSTDGKYLLVGEHYDELFLMSADTKELIRVLKHNSEVYSAAFSSANDKIYSYCKMGEVYIWDLTAFKVEQKFYDQGCITASVITTSPCGRLLATGSGEGIVNVYETAQLNNPNPFPTKVVQNLKTKITKLRFNPSSEILAMASSALGDAVKLVHIPSYHVFNNFPPKITLQNIESISFSPNSGFMGFGNNNARVHLYRLQHYPNY